MRNHVFTFHESRFINYENGITKDVSIRGGAFAAAFAEGAQVPATARAQLQGGNRRGGRMRRQARLVDGLRGYHGSVKADLGEDRPSLSERHCRPGKSDERRNRGMDLEKPEAEIAAAHRSRRGGDVHGTSGLPR